MKYISKTNGFTVLESIVAISLLSMAIAGAFTAVRTSVSSASIAKEETKAFYLAQEAIEMIRNKRDGNILDNLKNGNGVSWLAGIADVGTDPCYAVLGASANKTCAVDAYTNTVIACGANWDSCSPLRQDIATLPNGTPANPTYLLNGYNTSWGVTPFKREIQIERPNSNEVLITILVSWAHSGQPRQFKTKTILTNWF